MRAAPASCAGGRVTAVLLPFIILLPFIAARTTDSTAAPRVIWVCADPNNLPFSNARGEGIENRLAELIAADLDAKVSYTWLPQRRGFVRNTLNADECDVMMG